MGKKRASLGKKTPRPAFDPRTSRFPRGRGGPARGRGARPAVTPRRPRACLCGTLARRGPPGACGAAPRPPRSARAPILR
ncbi:hypothetical protein ISF6_1690 [Piscinibacter sakaiensis]|uniref:Uncharacterized protein n=1 Tax=Piscinibacter sakaiensis TaxID=1547922 RepID=A0A0K8NU46_PISS1|nr:hypothetical protein ISF6_1690 [Piscinibacter sakaiensis]